LFISQLGFLVSRIPSAVLAGLLVVVGCKLIYIPHLREVIRHKEAPVYFVTLLGVVGINLLVGIGLGLGTAAVLLLIRRCRIDVRIEQIGGCYLVSVRGSLTFLGVPTLSAHLATVPPGSQVAVKLDADYIDHAGLQALRAFTSSQQGCGGSVTPDFGRERAGLRREGSAQAL
jgi:carbonic anhydrase